MKGFPGTEEEMQQMNEQLTEMLQELSNSQDFSEGGAPSLDFMENFLGGSGTPSMNSGERSAIWSLYSGELIHSKIKDKRTHAFMLVDAIVKKLTPYLNSKSFKSYTDEDSKRVLFNFLDKYGLSTIDNSLIDSQISKFENTNRIVGSFILEECESNSETFNKLIELIKGVFLSKAIYLQTNNENIFKARMKDTVIILDAPLMLSILGLKTEGENRVAQEFLQVLPSEVKLHYFQHNFLQHP